MFTLFAHIQMKVNIEDKKKTNEQSVKLRSTHNLMVIFSKCNFQLKSFTYHQPSITTTANLTQQLNTRPTWRIIIKMGEKKNKIHQNEIHSFDAQLPGSLNPKHFFFSWFMAVIYTVWLWLDLTLSDLKFSSFYIFSVLRPLHILHEE